MSKLIVGGQPKLRITEIFYSLQGETRTSGLPTLFIRLTGCPLRCSYCDTAYAFSGGESMTIEQIMAQVEHYQPRYVTVTGGEPLVQAACIDLLDALLERGLEVSLETSGAVDISAVDTRVSRVMDLKTPSSLEVGRNLYSNIELLGENDQLKFVIGSHEDYLWSVAKINEFGLLQRCGEVVFSAVHGQLNPTQLADWIIKDNLMVRMQLQMHKYLWADEPGH